MTDGGPIVGLRMAVPMAIDDKVRGGGHFPVTGFID